jgi:hypothetical protein
MRQAVKTGIGVVLMIAMVTAILAATAVATTQTAPCETTKYRNKIVNVLGTSEELLSQTDQAYTQLKQGHVRRAKSIMHDVRDYLPTYFTMEHRLINKTVDCGL